MGLGEIPVTEFAMRSTDEVPDSVRPFVRTHSAVLLANHGSLAWGPTLLAAFDRLTTMRTAWAAQRRVIPPVFPSERSWA